MNALHLLWIVPLSTSFGFVLAALMQAAKVQGHHFTAPQAQDVHK